MKKLYDIKIIGENSPNIESFYSVLHRLSIIHGVTVNNILKFSISHFKEKNNDFSNIVFSRNYTNLALLVRPNETTKNLVECISTVTHNEKLRSTTFLALEDAVDCFKKTFINKIKWCPICFYESEQLNLDGYYKLIWSVKDVESCHVHNVKLVDKCHYCGAGQSTTGYRVSAIKCQRCKHSLSIPLEEISINDSWLSCDEGFLDLVREISSNPKLTYSRKGIRNFVKSILHHSIENNHEEKLANIIKSEDTLRVIYQDKPISMITLRRLAYQLGIRLTYLLSGETHYLQYSLNPEWNKIYSDNLKPVPKIKHNHQLIYSELMELKKSEQKFESLEEICNHLQVSSGYLMYRFPQLIAEIRGQ